jgi:hypothetical protein
MSVEKKRTFEEIILDNLESLNSEEEKINYLIDENVIPIPKFKKFKKIESLKEEVIHSLQSNISIKNDEIKKLLKTKYFDEVISNSSLPLLLNEIDLKSYKCVPYKTPIASLEGIYHFNSRWN